MQAQKTTNPYLTSLTSDTYTSPYSQPEYDTLTPEKIINKTGITLAVIITAAVVNFFIGMTLSYSLAIMLTLVGGIGGFIAVLVGTFGKKYGSATVTLVYAALEGLFVGGFSLIFAGVNVGGADVGVLIGQAVIGTIGVFIGMLVVYQQGWIKVTAKFNRVLLGALVAVLVLIVVNLLAAIFFDINVLRDGGPVAIVFSLACIALGALSFLTDFDHAERLIQARVPASYGWGVAMGLAVTLVWLYTEILRLLSYFRD